MKLLISNQHGAIVMALMPFLYGMLLSHPIWQHIFFLLAWFSLYLMTYPFLNLFKGRNLELYIKWSWIYFFACVIFAIPVLIYNWHTVLFVAAMLPFVLISIYYVKQKDERAFLNDLAGIVIFAIADQFSLPIRYIGVGEKIEDLREFNAEEFIDALFAHEEE